jgi:uncharacterized membrane protein HdeD (DUF308 family)
MDYGVNELFGYDPKYEGFDLRYPSPPRIHWLVLVLGWIAIDWIIRIYVGVKWRGIAQSLVVDAWVFYLCNWLRLLQPDSKSPFWCDVYLVAELGFAGLAVVHRPSPALSIITELLGLAAGILGIVTIFLIRRDLEDHYNNHEHAALVLSGFMTFFFSFIYFQYHLYDIAQRRKRVAEALGANAYGSLIS